MKLEELSLQKTSSQSRRVFLVGSRHLKNLSMVLRVPALLAFLDGGEDGVSRLRREGNESFFKKKNIYCC